MTPQAFEGIKVLELCSFVAGPYCGRLLADAGADVVKVEPPHTGDPARRRGPFYQDHPGPDHSLLFLYLNANKRSITLDPSTATGRRLLLDLVARVDVLIEDMPPAQVESLDLTVQALHRQNPALIVASITPFGRTGPHHSYKANYLNTYHSGGDAYTMPAGQLQDELSPGREPIKMGGYVGEYQAGLTACVGVLGALMGRLRNGQGRHIDLSKQEALALLNGPNLGRFPNRGVLETRHGLYIAYYVGGLFRCKDGFWEFLLNSDRAWEAVVEFMGSPEWTKDLRFQTHEDRVSHRREIEDRIEAWAMAYTKEELYHGLQRLGAAVGPVYTPTELVQDEQMRQRGVWAEVDHPTLGRLPMPSTGALMTGTPTRPSAPAPSLGQHNQDIYGDWLGIPASELAALRRSGII